MLAGLWNERKASCDPRDTATERVLRKLAEDLSKAEHDCAWAALQYEDCTRGA